jgi:signal transduction histidine kinase
MRQNRILLVDDEANVIASLRRQLHKQPYEIYDAPSGVEGLVRIKEKGPFAVIVSDYRMPGMDGIEFLARSQDGSPDASRIMLTGSNETEVAIKAVNHGNIFRFLLKPIGPESLISTIQAGVEQHRLIMAERSLLAELSMMQQIDLELNSSLDIVRTMKITLEWAVRQSGSSAGLVGRIREDEIQIMASQGYQDELQPYQLGLPLEPFPMLHNAIANGTPYQILIDSGSGMLKTVQSQAVMPIRRENRTIGILLLENVFPDLFPQETMQFLTRLCDHASTAISNAELYAAAQAANKAKSEFVSFVSHELRNPITSIGGFTELLLSGMAGPINDKQKEMLIFVKTGAQRMVTLVSDLSDISRIESGHLQLKLTATPVMEVIKEIIGTQQPQLNSKTQTLLLDIPSELPSVLADRNRLVQVLTNLVSNAVKYTPNGGEITLAAEVCPNRWDLKEDSEVVHIQVKDNGIGISPEEQKKVFQKFFRSADVHASNIQGTGLGLNITKNLIEMMGGHIWFESTLKKGTTFHFTTLVAPQDQLIP